ncbi:hypothetical protein [Pseudoalteromonas sp. T1lg23B]|uniref:hypothetical protein n=1 Tax=Pseudoalteromonas sp. T1lg23B TaxID=2077097 RepID=UPI001319D210|nr:hypothetical protein [Pseudoalteromonas sp. T1lg23B]
MIMMLAFFVAQSMAHASIILINDSMVANTTEPAQVLTASDDGHIASQNSDGCCEVECCEEQCICPANTCISFLYIENISMHSNLVGLVESILPLHTATTRAFITSLYRPPIFIS